MKKTNISRALLLVLMFSMFSSLVVSADTPSYAMYVYNDWTVVQGDKMVDGNVVVNGNVKGLEWGNRVANGKLFADPSKIERYEVQWGPRTKIDEYLSQTAYTGDVPDFNVDLKDFPVLPEKGELIVTKETDISESGWYSKLDVTNTVSADAFTITVNEGEVLRLRVNELKINNSINVVGGGMVIMYVDNLTSGSIPRINEGGNSENFAIYFSEGGSNVNLNIINGNFNVYTKTRGLNITDCIINGNIFTNGYLRIKSSIINGFVGGTNCELDMDSSYVEQQTQIQYPNIKGQVVAKNAKFSYGPWVLYADTGDLNTGVTKAIQSNGEPEATATPEVTPTPTPEATPTPTPEATATPGQTEYVNGILGEYYDAHEFTNESALKMKRIDDRVHFNWAFGSPDNTIEPETYAVKWTGYIKPENTSDYIFKTFSDDGVRVKIDGNTIIDRWGLLNLEYVLSDPVSLEAGTYHKIEVEYQQLPLHSLIFLFWESQGKMEKVPESVLYVEKSVYDEYITPKYYNPVAGNGDGLTASFYNYDEEGNVEETPVTVEKSAVNYDWGAGAPGGVTGDAFYGVIEGRIEAKYTGTISLSFIIDDAVRVYIDDNLIIDEWKSHSNENVTGSFEATAGQKYNIRIEYADLGLGATCIMRWFSDIQPLQVVPLRYLYQD